MRKTIKLKLDLINQYNYNREFSLRTGDAVLLDIDVLNNGGIQDVSNQIIRLFVRKSDGSLVMQKDGIEMGIIGNNVLVELKTSATNVPGLCYMELEFQSKDNASILTTSSPILFEVETRIGDVEDAILGVDDLYILGEIEKFIEDSKIAMEEIKQGIADSKVIIDEFGQLVIDKTQELQDIADYNVKAVIAEKEKAVIEINSVKNVALEELEIAIEEATAVYDSLVPSTQEAIEVKNALDSLIVTCGTIKTALEKENIEANANIAELTTLHPQADTRITKLGELIEEAKKYETIVRDWIIAQGGGGVVDLTEVWEAIENIHNRVEYLESNSIVYKGEIGTGTKFMKEPPVYQNMPAVPDGKTLYHTLKYTGSKEASTTGEVERIIYFYKPMTSESPGHCVIPVGGGTFSIRGFSADDYKTFYNNDGVWSSSKNTGYPETGIVTKKFFYMDFDIYANTDRQKVVMYGATSEKFSDIDRLEIGIYKLKCRADEIKDINGMPEIISETDFDTSVKCWGDESEKYIEFAHNGVIYTKKVGGKWNNTDNQGALKGERSGLISSNIEGNNIPEVFKTLPPTTELTNWDIHATVYGRNQAENSYLALYSISPKQKIYFWDNGANYKYIGITEKSSGRYKVAFVYDPSTGNWNKRIGGVNYLDCHHIYYNSTDIVVGTHWESWKDEIYKEKSPEVDEPTFADCNEITKTGYYYYDNSEVLNIPQNGAGLVEVQNGDDVIIQKYTANNKMYSRTYTDSWTDWAEVGGGSIFPTTIERINRMVEKVQGGRYRWLD